MTRDEHIQWAKRRAIDELEYYPNPQKAIRNSIVSICSDLGKHDETRGHKGIELAISMLVAGFIRTKDDARKMIEGFN